MSIFVFLTVVQAVVAALLIGIILMQKSEGGGLGTGGSPTGLMSARGAADLLTRITAILATLFVVFSIVLAALAVRESRGRQIDDSLNSAPPTRDQPGGIGLGAPAQSPGQSPAQNLAPGMSQAPAAPAQQPGQLKPGQSKPAKRTPDQ